MIKRIFASRTATAFFCLTALVLSAGASVQASPSESSNAIDSRILNTPKDLNLSEADAVFLLDDISFRLEDDGSTVYHEHDAIKVLNQEGIERYDTVMRFYQSDVENIKVIKARTISPEGLVSDVPESQIYKGAVSEDTPVYANRQWLVIKYGDLKAGSVVEYDIETTKKQRADKKWWSASYLQNSDPMAESVFTCSVPAKADFKYNLQGLKLTPSIVEKDGRKTYTWKSGPSQPLKEEVGMPSSYTYYHSIAASNFGGWDDLVQWYGNIWQESQKNLTGEKLGLLCTKITSATASPQQKVKDITSYVSSNYNVQLLVPDFYNPTNPEDLVSSKLLSINDSAFLLGALLTRSGLEVTPLAATSRSLEDLRQTLPIPESFDQLILRVKVSKDNYLWINPLAPGAVSDAPPANYQNVAMMQLPTAQNSGMRAFTSPQSLPGSNYQDARLEVSVKPSGVADAALQLSLNGMPASYYRNLVHRAANWPLERRNSLAEREIQQVYTNFCLPVTPYSHFFPEQVSDNKPVTLNSAVVFANLASYEKKNSLYKALTVIFRTNSLYSSLLNKDKRLYPLTLPYTGTEETRTHVVLPAGSEIISVPKTINATTPVGTYFYRVRAGQGEYWCYSRLSLNKAWTDPEDVKRYAPLVEALKQASASTVDYRLSKKSDKDAKAADTDKTSKDKQTVPEEKGEDIPIPSDL